MTLDNAAIWPDIPVYFEYKLQAEASSEDEKTVAERISKISIKMVLKGPVSDGGLITSVVFSALPPAMPN